MEITATELRSNLYRILDRVIETGEPVLLKRKGKRIKIAVDKPGSKFSRLVRREGVIKGDPDDLVHIDWSEYWKP
jgi:hypothetical protein